MSKSDYVEYYQNVTCYTKPGPVENSYLVYVYYEVKFHDIDTVAPGLNTLYVCTNDTGELYVFSGDVDSYVSEYMQLVSTQQDVKDLFNRVQVTYNDAVDSDEDLKAFLEDLAVNLKNDVILKWEKNFYRRFFAQHFKRSCLPDGPKVGTVAVSPRGDLRMPTDACAAIWLKELDGIVE